jgi:pimeloyl-ACP methyl ester carboxylesterase
VRLKPKLTPTVATRLLAAGIAFALWVSFGAVQAHAFTRQTAEQAASPGRYSYQYILYVPPHFHDNATTRWPIMVVLHGAGEVGTDLKLAAKNGPPFLIEQGQDFPAIVISPQSPVFFWDTPALAAFVDDMVVKYQADPNRVYITGLSMGGYGTWALATAYPDRYAAIVPVCGGGDPRLAYKLRDLPVWAFHGALDPTVPIARSQEMIDGIVAAGGHPIFTIYPTAGHDAWTATYANAAMYDWMFRQAKATPLISPSITAQPQGHAIAAGSTGVITVEAQGGNLSYQWQKDGVALLDATAAQLILTSTQSSDAGNYTVTVTNSAGSITSAPAPLSVVATSDPGRIINLSVRTTTGSGANVLIVGFVTGGTKDLLIRGLGPLLADFNVPSVLADPLIQILPQGSSSILAQNDDWAGDARVSTIGGVVGATPLTRSASKDAALVVNLASGAYSVKVVGVGDTTGTALAEVYDATPSAADPSTPRLINISGRAQMSNENPLIAGFVIIGSTAQTVMVRGIGPYLSKFFGADAMADPKLDLYMNQANHDVLLASNDDWGGTAQIASTAHTVGAFVLPDPTSKDAVLLLTLDPGVYTAQITSADHSSGIALVEVYAVP